MNQFIPFKNSKIHFRDIGSGNTIVLLHGYLESGKVWGKFADELSKSFRIIIPDIPGHGLSGKVAEIHTMELMAESINFLTDELKINKFHLAGHSLGGYISLAFTEQFGEKLKSLILIHSNCWSDSQEKISSRNKEIEFIKKGRKSLIVNVNIPNAFNDDNLETFKDEIERCKQLANQTSDDGIIALLEGMKLRNDKTQFLNSLQIPVMLVLGKKDNYLPLSTTLKMLEQTDNKRIVILENSGHMGFIEQRKELIKEIEVFIKNN